MNILPPCLCNRPQRSTWLKMQCSNCLGVLKDSLNINCSSQTSLHFAPSDTFSKSLIEYLSNGNKFMHKRSCTDKAQQSLSNLSKPIDKFKHLLRNPSEPFLIHKPNQLSAPACMYKKKEYLKRENLYFGHTNSVNCIAIQDNKLWTAGADYKVFSWFLPLNEGSVSKYEGKGRISSNIAHSRSITGIIAVNSETLLTSSIDKTVKIWTTNNGLVKTKTFKQKAGVKCLSVLNTSFISATSDNKISIWDLNQNINVLSFSEHIKPVISIDNFKCNTFLTGSEDSIIKLWDSRASHSISSFTGHSDLVTSIKIVDQYSFLSGSRDRSVKTWDIRTFGVCKTLELEQEVTSIDWYKDLLIIGGDKLQVWSKNILLAETYADAKCVKYASQTGSVVVGSFDNSVSIYKIIL